MRKTMPVARRVLGEGDQLTLKMRWVYAMALYKDDSASLDHLREAVMMYEDNARIARRVYGGAHPLVVDIEHGRKCHKLCFTPSPFECSKGACVDNYQFPYWDSA